MVSDLQARVLKSLPNTAIWLVRESARPLAEKLGDFLEALVLPDATPDMGPAPSNRERFVAAFPSAKQWVMLMASGIATRYLAGLPYDKNSDPGVVVLDEACRFAIPLLCGHEGGANALAYRIAAKTGAVPVITTATEALKPLTLGIGCRKGVSVERIDDAIANALRMIGASLSSVREIATVDLKGREPGLIKWVEQNDIPLRIFSSEQLAQRPLTATPSRWVFSSIGLAGVCEPCALLASPRGTLVVPKLATAGVTVAVVSDGAPIQF